MVGGFAFVRQCALSCWHYSRCTDSDFFAIRKITHMSAEILSRIVENFIDGAKRSGKVLISLRCCQSRSSFGRFLRAVSLGKQDRRCLTQRAVIALVVLNFDRAFSRVFGIAERSQKVPRGGIRPPPASPLAFFPLAAEAADAGGSRPRRPLWTPL